MKRLSDRIVRQPRSAVAEATVTLTLDEEARLEALMADEASPEKPA